MSKVDRTPGPWKVGHTNRHGYAQIDSPTHLGLAEVPVEIRYNDDVCPRLSEQARANVEFIVRACNAHDDLLAACESWVAYFDQLDDLSEPGHSLVENYHRKRVEATRAAVSKAKGGAA
jgi:hypothetical protein